MILGRVVGTVVATRKDERLLGAKLLLVRAIDPKGKFLIASGEKSPTISVYAIDGATGGLRMLKQYPVGKGANWVEIVSFD